jgi:hypothetical protein
MRVTTETAVVVALAMWGYTTNGLWLAVVAPIVGFGFWGAVDFRWMGRWAEALRLTQEIAVSGLAATAWYLAGWPTLGVALGALSLIYHASVYASGERLLLRASHG